MLELYAQTRQLCSFHLVQYLKNMNKRPGIKIFFLIIFFLNIFYTSAADYYVSSSTGSLTGTGTESDPWMTIGQVNDYAVSPRFADGDTIKFKCGDTFDDETLGSPMADNITYESYGTGDKPLFDGDVIQPVFISDADIKNLTIKNIDISGQDFCDPKSSNIYISSVRGISIDGVIGNGHRNGNNTAQAGNTAIILSGCYGMIEIKNCNLYNWGPDTLPSLGADCMGIALTNTISGTYNIHDNTVYNVNADAYYFGANTAPGKLYDNTGYNCGENCVDIKSSSNLQIYNNDFYRESGYGSGGTSGAGYHIIMHCVLMEDGLVRPCYNNIISNNTFGYNYPLGGIRLDNSTSLPDYIISGTIIENNTFSDSEGVAIRVAHKVSDTVINSNWINSYGGGVTISDGVMDTLIVNNVIMILDTEADGTAAIYENNLSSGTSIYNNTIYCSSGTYDKLIYLACCNHTEVKNNLLYMDDSNSSTYPLYIGSSASSAVIDHNLFYNPSSSNRVYWDSTSYTSTEEAAWQSAGHSGSLFGAPDFLDSDNDDLRLVNGSLGIDAGTNVSREYDYDGIHVPQNGIPDIGAYEMRHYPVHSTCTWIEAEKYSYKVGGFVSVDDTNASGGQYMHTPNGTGSDTDGDGDPEIFMRYNLQATAGGTYYIWIRTYGTGSGSNSFYVGVDNETGPFSYLTATIGEWQWKKLSSSYTFSQNTSHTLDIRVREDGACVDQILLTTDSSYSPSGTGESTIYLYSSTWVEAEEYSYKVGGFVSVDDTNVSGGQYMHTPNGTGSDTDGDGDPEIFMRYNLQATAGGTYYIWIRTCGTGSGSDSFYVGVDNETGPFSYLTATIGEWQWKKLSSSYTFSQNTSHTLDIRVREDGACVDQILLTTDSSYSPVEKDSDIFPLCKYSWIEAEDASIIKGAFVSGESSDAFRGQYMTTPDDTGSDTIGSGLAETNYLKFKLHASIGGTYYVWLRLTGVNSDSNSVFISMDGGTKTTVDADLNAFEWVELSSTYTFTQGSEHDFVVHLREDGTQIDQIIFTTDDIYEPE